MSDQRLIPDDPLSFIQNCIREGRLFWSYHVNMRLDDAVGQKSGAWFCLVSVVENG